MSKAAVVKKYSLKAEGILDIHDDLIGLEIEGTGEFISLVDLLSDFKDKTVKLSINYDKDYGSDEE